MSYTVVDKVVNQGLCIGCGVCAGVCSMSVLSIRFNQFGEYNAYENTPCNVNCGQCLKVCPFFFENDNEDVLAKERFIEIPGIKHRKETGFYLSSYYGYSLENSHRARGASGGLATWLLENLLIQKKVEYVVCVTSSNDYEKLFKFQIFNSVQEIRNSAGSVYYPVELSEAVKFFLRRDASFALVGVPCFIKAIRLAQKTKSELNERLRYLIGLVCGQTKSKHYTCFIASMAGVNGILSKVFFRKKDQSRSADNFAFQAENVKGEYGEILWQDRVGDIWANRWFTPQSCNYCDDIFAELADVVFMDAWLTEYVKDSRGANLVIIRNPLINELFKSASLEKKIYINEIPIEHSIESQAGLLLTKRRQLAYRLFLDQRCGVNGNVSKRIKSSNKLSFIEKLKVHVTSLGQKKIRVLFCEAAAANNIDQVVFNKFFSRCLQKLVLMRVFLNFISIPERVGSKINRILNRKYSDD